MLGSFGDQQSFQWEARVSPMRMGDGENWLELGEIIGRVENVGVRRLKMGE